MTTESKTRTLATPNDLTAIHRQLDALIAERPDLWKLEDAIDNVDDMIWVVEAEMDG